MLSSGGSRSTTRSNPGAIRSVSTSASGCPRFFSKRIFVGGDVDDDRTVHRECARQQFFQLAGLVHFECGTAERFAEFCEIDGLLKAPDFSRALHVLALVGIVDQRYLLIERAVVVDDDNEIDAV